MSHLRKSFNSLTYPHKKAQGWRVLLHARRLGFGSKPSDRRRRDEEVVRSQKRAAQLHHIFSPQARLVKSQYPHLLLDIQSSPTLPQLSRLSHKARHPSRGPSFAVEHDDVAGAHQGLICCSCKTSCQHSIE